MRLFITFADFLVDVLLAVPRVMEVLRTQFPTHVGLSLILLQNLVGYVFHVVISKFGGHSRVD